MSAPRIEDVAAWSPKRLAASTITKMNKSGSSRCAAHDRKSRPARHHAGSVGGCAQREAERRAGQDDLGEAR